MRGVVSILGEWLNILHACFARDWPSTSLLQILDTPLSIMCWQVQYDLLTFALGLLVKGLQCCSKSFVNQHGNVAQAISKYCSKLEPSKAAISGSLERVDLQSMGKSPTKNAVPSRKLACGQLSAPYIELRLRDGLIFEYHCCRQLRKECTYAIIINPRCKV